MRLFSVSYNASSFGTVVLLQTTQLVTAMRSAGLLITYQDDIIVFHQTLALPLAEGGVWARDYNKRGPLQSYLTRRQTSGGGWGCGHAAESAVLCGLSRSSCIPIEYGPPVRILLKYLDPPRRYYLDPMCAQGRSLYN